MGGKYLVTTLGCKVNQYESQEYREACETLGLTPAQPGELPDWAIVNTCAVTSDALRQSRQAVRRLARGGRTSVVVVGCGASAQPDPMNDIDGVVAVLGHDVDVCAELRKLLSGNQPNASNSDERLRGPAADGKRPEENGYELRMIAAGTANVTHASSRYRISPREIVNASLPVVNTVDSLPSRIHRFEGRHRAFLKIQDGCDAYCTYCIIPRLRPSVRSKSIDHVLTEARGLIDAGFREIVLTGVFLGAYGRDTAIRKRFAGGRQPLAALVESLAGLHGLDRLRLSSLEPGDVDEDLLDVMRSHPTCVPHLHLPLQSGSARILRKMNRQYSRDDFLSMIDRVRTKLPEPAISTDLIVGFPGETDQDFEDGLAVARYAEFCKIHAFPFSPRDHTAAARWTSEFVPPAVVRERMQRLSKVEELCSLTFRRRLLGTVERVIVEGERDFRLNHGDSTSDTRLLSGSLSLDEPAAETAKDDAGHLHWGRADRYVTIHFHAEGVRPGDLVRVHVDRVTPVRVYGSVANHAPGTVSLPVLHPLAQATLANAHTA